MRFWLSTSVWDMFRYSSKFGWVGFWFFKSRGTRSGRLFASVDSTRWLWASDRPSSELHGFGIHAGSDNDSKLCDQQLSAVSDICVSRQ